MPSLSLQAGLSTSYYRTLTGSGGDVPSFSNQLKNKLGEYIGVSLSIPLFSAGTLTSVKRAKLNYKRAQIDHEETMQQLRNDKRQAVMDCLALQGEIEKMHTKVAADSVAYGLNVRKYEEGLLSALELQTAANTLLNSKVTLLQKEMLMIIKKEILKYYETPPRPPHRGREK